MAVKIQWANLTTPKKEREYLERRYERLLITERHIDKAAASLRSQGSKWPERVRVRPRFVYRHEPPTVEVSDRSLPPPEERPPATRLLKSGLALRFYLIALCAAQMRTRRGQPRNDLRLMGVGDDTGWTDLVAVPVKDQMSRRFAATRATKKLRQVTTALQRLSSADVQLVHLPNEGKRYGKYEGFQLLDEGGVRVGGDVPPYVVPPRSEKTFSLPSGLFSNGWIHLLENSELAFLMMVMELTPPGGKGEWLKIASGERLLHYGFGRDAYDAHKTLEAFRLLDVHADEQRHVDGKVMDYNKGAEALLHAVKLRPDGFEEPAVNVMKEYLKQFGNRPAS